MIALERYVFDNFGLDIGERTLLRDGVPVAELGSRYFDALALLVRSRGSLVGKQRFFDEVWAGAVVTDAALTQCIKDLRRALGDDAARPRYIQTVPGHGYRFVATVRKEGADEVVAPERPAVDARQARSRRFMADGLAGTLGGGVAGVFGGLLYGSALLDSASAQGVGTASVLVVLMALNIIAGLAGGFGVSLGLAAARWAGVHPAWTLVGAAASGFAIGGVLKMLGSDAFTVLFGHAPAGITGAPEGAVLGIAIAGGAWIAGTLDSPVRWRPVLGASIASGLAAAVLTGLGGRMMGGSLERLAGAFSGSRLDLAPLGRYFGETHFGAITQVAFGAVEGLLFGACVVAAMIVARRFTPPA